MFDQRFLKITVAVLLFHAGLLYLIQSGLGRKLTEAVIAPEIMARIIPMEPPKAPEPPAPTPPKPQPTPPKQVKMVTPRPTPPKPQPTPEPVASLPPSPTAIEAPPAPPAPPAPEPPAPAAPSNAAPRAVGIGEMACSQPSPVYPRQSQRMGETGTAVVRLNFDEAGKVIKAVVSKSSGSERLDEAAVTAAKNIRCKPYTENGRALAVTAQQPIKFELN
ncbi:MULTISPECIES: energy transducer TonB [unclassified Cupriavidus]|uniref:energy transducer TonB n=1 Tax=unclassified Cupriavidus TaxID=2640874 RepID=UPI0013662938|nr:energy transducer TonB [Cupriavidus sp. SW-Y-13]MWL87864.1 TonB family protein [Cupriavidus sp. SW-Y-13]